MSAIPWILIAVGVFLILFIFLVFLLIKKKKRAPDYYTFFIVGIIWLPIGIATGNHALSAMGVVFAIVGLINKKKWKENRRIWKKMDKDEKKITVIVIIMLSILVLLGLIFFVLST
jgi:hypothetical protein